MSNKNFFYSWTTLMFLLFLGFFWGTESVLAASNCQRQPVQEGVKCRPPVELEYLVCTLKEDINDLKSQFESNKNKCKVSDPITFTESGERINDKEYSPGFLRIFGLSPKMRIIDKFISGSSAEYRDALKEYYEYLPMLDEIKRKTSLYGYGSCLGEGYQKKLQEAYSFHLGVVGGAIPSAVGELRISGTLAYSSAEGSETASKLAKELDIENQRVCKDQETTKESGLNDVSQASGGSLKSQDKADRQAGGDKPEPLPPAPEMSEDFKESLARSDSTAGGDDFPAVFSLSTEELPEADESKTFLEDPVAWLWRKLDWRETKDPGFESGRSSKTRMQEEAFRVRHERWRNDRNYILNRVKDVSGVRTDGFAKKLRYTYIIINKINSQLVETLGYKDTVCKCQKNPTYGKCEKT